MRRAFALVAFLIFIGTPTLGQISGIDARLGTWRLNLGKSRFDPAINLENALDPAICPPLPNQTLIYEATPDGRVIVTSKRIDENGQTSTRSATVTTATSRHGGMEHVMAGNSGAGMYGVYVIDDYNTMSMLRKGREVLLVVLSFVSPDRQMLRLTIKNAALAETIEVFDRQ